MDRPSRPPAPETSRAAAAADERPAPASETPDALAEPAEPEPVEPAPQEPEPEEAGRGAADLVGQWGGIIGELKRRKQALTAAVYGEARVEGFDGTVLTLAFPEDQDFYVGMAKDRKHADVLGEVLEERIGSKPRLEVRSGEGDPEATPVPTGEPSRGTPPQEPVPRGPAPEPPAHLEEPPAGLDDESFDQTVARADVPGARFGAPEAGGETGEGKIRSEAEVFEIMRGFEPFGRRDES